MMIHSIDRADGSVFMWARRDTIAGTAARGDLREEEFTAFLETMDEAIIWLEDQRCSKRGSSPTKSSPGSSDPFTGRPNLSVGKFKRSSHQ